MLPTLLVVSWVVMGDRPGPELTATLSGAVRQLFLGGDKRWQLPMGRAMVS